MSFINAENIRTCKMMHIKRNSFTLFFFLFLTLKSELPAARRTLLGCQSIVVTVDLMDFLMCLETHQSFSLSK